MSPSNPQIETFTTCTHERGPGTTVCLRCRAAERAAARNHFNRVMLRVSTVAIGVATVVAVGAAGTSAIRTKLSTRGDNGVVATAHAEQVTSEFADSTTTYSSDGTTSLRPKAAPKAKLPPSHTSRSAVTPILPAGQSVLAEGVVATRADSEVTVSFDSPMVRTRRAEKFELFLRTTLPLVYGAPVQTALRSVPEGGIASQGELLTELPERGVRIPLDSVWTVRVYPETRPGQDGPLVVRYRALVTTARE